MIQVCSSEDFNSDADVLFVSFTNAECTEQKIFFFFLQRSSTLKQLKLNVTDGNEIHQCLRFKSNMF